MKPSIRSTLLALAAALAIVGAPRRSRPRINKRSPWRLSAR